MRSVQLPWGVEIVLPSNQSRAAAWSLKSGASGRVRKIPHWSWAVPSVATIRRSRVSRLLAPTIAGMSPA